MVLLAFAGMPLHQVGGSRSAAHTRLGNLEHLAARCAEPAGQARPFAERVDEQHLEVTPACQGTSQQLGPAERENGGVTGHAIGEDQRRRVSLELVGQPPHLLLGIGARQHPARQPPERAHGRMPIDEPPAGGDERRRVVGESRQRVRCLERERRRTGSVSPGHVPKPLNGVHGEKLPGGGLRSATSESATFHGRGDGSPWRPRSHAAEGRRAHRGARRTRRNGCGCRRR